MPDESISPAILFTLKPEEARVLGCLIEKEITLPDYYPHDAERAGHGLQSDDEP
jgi:hypothetical protein